MAYVGRWCQASFTQFKYYKSQWNFPCAPRKPLMSIPFSYVKSIQRVEVKLPQKATKELYQFEIFLKKDVNLSLLARNSERSMSERKCLSYKASPRDSCCSQYPENSERSPRNTLKASQSCQANETDPEASSKSVKAKAYSCIREGHLMRDRAVSELKYKGKSNVDIRSKTIEYEGMVFKDKKQLKRFERFRSKYEAQAKAVTVAERKSTKNPSGWIPALSSKALATHRLEHVDQQRARVVRSRGKVFVCLRRCEPVQ
eukprot:TRINITY_DN14390_c0_g1_i2.p1 TRINITY_DN14390_c0_g1~~TRINITY_DN14390_c0_g1_i2.p1  ORF type:complete len:258 (+),score=42.78 TRINITY_DN14390_c0_g1_i2:617-1390(+)